jgi:NAD(P)-dependent dehydrogenase (short-subunit alcohol dehydrogenase family)
MNWRENSRTVKKRAHQAKQVAKAGVIIGGIGTGIALGVGAASVGLFLRNRTRRLRYDLAGKVVVITGGSRGLGFALAQECASQGANVAICARDEQELRRAQQSIAAEFGMQVLSHVCNVTSNEEVQEFIRTVLARFGRIDVLINNAGIISVGPVESQTLEDFEEAMDVMYWGAVYPTLAAFPQMQSRGEGRIANIASIGGKMSVPHLLPYSAAKFATVGFSEGLRAELAKDGVKVTTVCPGLMRTGSHLNAYFKGKHRQEFTWFSFGATLPVISIDARRAARKIVNAIRRGDAELVITPQAKLAALAHGIAPGVTANVLGLVNRAMPGPNGDQDRYLGKDSQTVLTRSFLQKAGQEAAEQYHQHPEEVPSAQSQLFTRETA